MQNCNGFAEAALRHCLIMPAHHPVEGSRGTGKVVLALPVPRSVDDAAAGADAPR